MCCQLPEGSHSCCTFHFKGHINLAIATWKTERSPPTVISIDPSAAKMQLVNYLAITLASVASFGSCVPAVEKRQESCNQDNCYRQMEQNLGKASTFCPTFTLSSAMALPTFVSMCQDLPLRVSSACACLVPTTPAPITATVATPPATTTKPLACNQDNCYRKLQASSSQASGFCPTYTLSLATAPIPTFANSCGGLPSRISSAYSCLYPRTAVPIGTTVSAPTSTATSSCKNPAVRKEWRGMTTTEKDAYIDAVLCLTKTDAISGISGTVNRYDDFHAVSSFTCQLSHPSSLMAHRSTITKLQTSVSATHHLQNPLQF